MGQTPGWEQAECAEPWPPEIPPGMIIQQVPEPGVRGHSQALTPREVLDQPEALPEPRGAGTGGHYRDTASVDYGEPASSPQGGQGQLIRTPPNLGVGTASQELLTQLPHVRASPLTPSPPSLPIPGHLCTPRTHGVTSHPISNPHPPET